MNSEQINNFFENLKTLPIEEQLESLRTITKNKEIKNLLLKNDKFTEWHNTNKDNMFYSEEEAYELLKRGDRVKVKNDTHEYIFISHKSNGFVVQEKYTKKVKKLNRELFDYHWGILKIKNWRENMENTAYQNQKLIKGENK